MSATDVADGRPCPTPATEALKVFMTQHVHQSKSASSSTDHPPRPVSEDGDDDDKNIEPLDLSELCREAIRVEQHAYDSAAAVTDDDAFPCIAWNSDDEDDTEDEEYARTNENHPFHPSKKRPRHQIRRASHQESSRLSSCEDVRHGNTTTRKRRSSEPLPQACCGLHRCKTRKMCLPRCIDQQDDNCCESPMPGSNSRNAPLSTSRQLSLSVGSSLDNTTGTTTPDLDPAAFLVATCPQATSWGQFALTSSNPSTPNSPSYALIRTRPSRSRSLRNSLKKANSFGNVILPLRSNDQ